MKADAILEPKSMNSRSTDTAAEATLIIGANLRVSSVGGGWRALGLRGLGRPGGKRIGELFPSGDLRASVLDVLTSGQPVEGVLIPVEDGERTRYLCANLSPVPANSLKPQKVSLRVHDLDGWVLADADTGQILGANESGAAAFGSDPKSVLGKSLWSSDALTDPEERNAVFAALNRSGSKYLGHFRQESECGEALELEGALVLVQE